MSSLSDKKSKIIFITVLMLLLVTVTAAVTWWIAGQVRFDANPNMNAQSSSSISSTHLNKNQSHLQFPAGSLDPLMPNDFFWTWRYENRLATEAAAKAAEPSVGCTKKLGWPSVQVPMDQFNLAFGNRPGEIPELPIEVDPYEVCYTEGYGIWIIGVQPTQAGMFSPDAIWSRIVRVEKSAVDKKIKLITQFIGTPIYHWPSRALSPFHPQAQILNREGFVKIFDQLDYIVDVRTSAVQKQWPLSWKNLVSIPYIATSESLSDYKADRTDNRKATHLNLNDQWPDEAWKNWDLKKNILIIGQNPTDTRAFRALTWLAEAGFKNLYWFYEGADAFYQPFNEVPIWNTYNIYWADHIPNIQQQIVSDQAILIDVRSAEEFQRIRHPKSINKPYKESHIDGFGALRGYDALDIFKILKSGDMFDLSQIPEDRKIYLIGADRYDWRAIKLFVRLKHRSPKQEIYVIRDGLAEFGLWQRINRDLIKLDGAKANEVH